ncbi:hypothetical protein GCM10023171_31940 [Microbacterium panaciterrae]|uniref:Uncharacterized protein n=1 Tax=Microbacterium panaciterrae TaxID=985759 RepID=A0ABP8PMH8_9MICO
MVAIPVAARVAPKTAAATRFVVVFMVLRSGAEGACAAALARLREESDKSPGRAGGGAREFADA